MRYSSFQVRRESLVRDVANQVAATPPSDLKKKLKVTFVGEDALDAGGKLTTGTFFVVQYAWHRLLALFFFAGVTKELFQLLVRQLLDPLYGASELIFCVQPLDLS